MKNKFTSIIMFFIVIAIIIAFVLLGMAVLQETNSLDEKETQTGIGDFVSNSEDEYYYENKTKKADISDVVSTNIIFEEAGNTNSKTNSNVTINYENTLVNGHYYNQLEAPSKKIYKALANNKEKMKTGNYKIELGDSLKEIQAKEDGSEQLNYYYQSAIEAYINDNPDVFYLDTEKMFLNIVKEGEGNNAKYSSYIDCGEEDNYFSAEFKSKEQIDEAIKELEKIRNEILAKRTGNTYEDIKMVHDYLIQSIAYDQTLSRENTYNIYGALINKVCVCEGYSEAFKYLLDSFGIESIIVAGNATNLEGQNESHAWNYVKINDKWYVVDCTWDDPIVIGNGILEQEAYYKYFLKGSRTINDNHFPTGVFSTKGKKFEYPELSIEDYI